MRIFVFAILGAAIVALAAWPSSSASKPDPAGTPIVVELFTSEGCSSCPPADALLANLGTRGDVLILGEHVDYWDQLGWKDRFSSSEFSERQRRYAQRFGLDSVYTPQMVIDGRYEIVGNDERGVQKEIAQSSQKRKDVGIALLRNGDQLTIEAKGPAASGTEILLAITEDGLSTNVGRGENGGRTLRHSGVVRDLKNLGSVQNGQFSRVVSIRSRKEWDLKNLKLVAFAQDQKTGEVVGAAALKW